MCKCVVALNPSRIYHASSGAASPAAPTHLVQLDAAELNGKPVSWASYPFWALHDRFYWGSLGKYIARARAIPSWTRGDEAVSLATTSYALRDDAVIVEIGSLLGCSTVLLAGARRLRGSGTVHCVDPFDLSGEEFSVAIYHAIGSSLRRSPREQFDRNVRRAGLADWVEVHQGAAADIGATWSTPIDFLFLDGDYSAEGALSIFRDWSGYLKPGGILAVHGSSRDHDVPGHNGNYRVVVDAVRPPLYSEIRRVGTTTFARKTEHGHTP
jgi:predicted O-methyltransferase YrrM